MKNERPPHSCWVHRGCVEACFAGCVIFFLCCWAKPRRLLGVTYPRAGLLLLGRGCCWKMKRGRVLDQLCCHPCACDVLLDAPLHLTWLLAGRVTTPGCCCPCTLSSKLDSVESFPCAPLHFTGC
ncbi:hypothetical protein VIGAN_05220900 [Vigna angularis var. angularis]|uniref:Uncharacterized protein n=1 Tax=Vigna angularis var. angularis TaxID=157739 RepID=A0A0S3S768_PHAAN|nr:hypothetical protein VIGAN_05220900 [Vigna angularis var. angularis]